MLSVPGGYRLGDAAGRGIDLVEAGALVRTARAAAGAGQPAPALAAARRALDLLGGGAVLTDHPGAEWAEPARAEATRLLRAARHAAASAALAVGDAEAAAVASSAAVGADPLDETGSRLLMRAHQLAGEPGRGLAEYARLVEVLAAELGADPAEQTRALHLALLRNEPHRPAAAAVGRSIGGAHLPPTVPSPPAAGAGPDDPRRRLPPPVPSPVGGGAADPLRRLAVPAAGGGLVGREAEAARLAELWSAATAGRPGCVLLTGAAGIGKTRLTGELAALAADTGGLVLQARCYGTERSLFLQPLADAVRPAVTGLPPAVLAELSAPDPTALASVVPDLEAVLGPAGPLDGGPDVRLRRAFTALAGFLRRLADRAPVLLVLDDLQEAGLTTVDFVHHLARHAAGAPLLVVAVARTGEGDEATARLADVAATLSLEPLGPDAVRRLAADADHADLGGELYRRTRGHTRFVVETLRGLRAGEPGVPRSLREAVLARVRRLGGEVEEALRAASVLGPPFDPATLAGVLDIPGPEAARRCEQALRTALLSVVGDAYEFANDLVQEVLYATTPAPTRAHHHARAADLLTDRPEAAAVHAAAAGQPLRAARAWLRASEQALRRWAAPEAEAFAGRALGTLSTVDDAARVELSGRLHLARGRAREARGEFAGAWADDQQAVALAREAGDQRLEMAALRQLGGDVLIGQDGPIELCVSYLEAGVRIARGLGDRTTEADLLARLAVVSTNQLRFDVAIRHGQAAVAVARAVGEPAAIAAALDGLKTAYAYLGDVAALGPVVAELEPLLRSQGDLWRLQWMLLESAFPAVARGDWAAALDRIAVGREVNRRSRFGAYEAWFVVHAGWVRRLRGELALAEAAGREAVELAGSDGGGHPWFSVASHAFLGSVLLATGDRAGAVAELERSVRPAGAGRADGFLLRGLAPLAEATGDRDLLARADRSLAAVTAPPGGAWMLGADAYLAVARGWLAAGAPERARAVLDRLLPAAEAAGWPTLAALAGDLAARCAAALGDEASARRLSERAAALAARHGVALPARAGR